MLKLIQGLFLVTLTITFLLPTRNIAAQGLPTQEIFVPLPAGMDEAAEVSLELDRVVGMGKSGTIVVKTDGTEVCRSSKTPYDEALKNEKQFPVARFADVGFGGMSLVLHVNNGGYKTSDVAVLDINTCTTKALYTVGQYFKSMSIANYMDFPYDVVAFSKDVSSQGIELKLLDLKTGRFYLNGVYDMRNPFTNKDHSPSAIPIIYSEGVQAGQFDKTKKYEMIIDGGRISVDPKNMAENRQPMAFSVVGGGAGVAPGDGLSRYSQAFWVGPALVPTITPAMGVRDTGFIGSLGVGYTGSPEWSHGAAWSNLNIYGGNDKKTASADMGIGNIAKLLTVESAGGPVAVFRRRDATGYGLLPLDGVTRQAKSVSTQGFVSWTDGIQPAGSFFLGETPVDRKIGRRKPITHILSYTRHAPDTNQRLSVMISQVNYSDLSLTTLFKKTLGYTTHEASVKAIVDPQYGRNGIFALVNGGLNLIRFIAPNFGDPVMVAAVVDNLKALNNGSGQNLKYNCPY